MKYDIAHQVYLFHQDRLTGFYLVMDIIFCMLNYGVVDRSFLCLMEHHEKLYTIKWMGINRKNRNNSLIEK